MTKLVTNWFGIYLGVEMGRLTLGVGGTTQKPYSLVSGLKWNELEG